jgi:hypothetical protein
MKRRKGIVMFLCKRIVPLMSFVIFAFLPLGCASSIVEGEHIRTSTPHLAPKPPGATIEIFFYDNPPSQKWREVGKIVSRAYVL